MAQCLLSGLGRWGTAELQVIFGVWVKGVGFGGGRGGVKLRLAISSQLGGPWRYWGSACLIPEAQAQMGPSALEWGGFSLQIIREGVSRGLCPAADLLPETV